MRSTTPGCATPVGVSVPERRSLCVPLGASTFCVDAQKADTHALKLAISDRHVGAYDDHCDCDGLRCVWPAAFRSSDRRQALTVRLRHFNRSGPLASCTKRHSLLGLALFLARNSCEEILARPRCPFVAPRRRRLLLPTHASTTLWNTRSSQAVWVRFRSVCNELDTTHDPHVDRR